MRKLFNQLHLNNLWEEFCKTVIGFADTLLMFKIMYQMQNGMKNYKQETLVGTLLDVTYNAHNAEKKDVELLQRLVCDKGKCRHSGIRAVFSFIQHSCLQNEKKN